MGKNKGKLRKELARQRHHIDITNRNRRWAERAKEPEDFKDIKAAVIAVYEKIGPSAVMEILGKCGARCERTLHKDQYARFLRLAKDYLSSV